MHIYKQTLQRIINKMDANVQPWQGNLEEGTLFNCTVNNTEEYGIVLPEEEFREPHLRHYRSCRCYSAESPNGEIKQVHLSEISKTISKDKFDKAILDLAKQNNEKSEKYSRRCERHRQWRTKHNCPH